VTKLAVISDVHADLHALRDALGQIARIGVERTLCCGDLLDYGMFPEETLTVLREQRISCIRGNHDRWAVASGSDMSGWDLSEASVAYLDALPTHWRKLIDGTRVVLAHARPENDMHGIAPDAPGRELVDLLDEAGADVLLVGHTHVPFARRLPDGRLVCNPGALLRDPAPGIAVLTPGTFGILDVAGGTATFEVRRALDGKLVELR
jgi:putative phosphoesterase